MRITIEEGRLEATVDTLGAGLTSLRLDGREYLWSGDPAVWSGQAPILFPVVGRLRGGGYLHRGRRYELAKHGFVRTRELRVEEASSAGARFSLEADDATRAVYPFEFSFLASFSAKGGALRVVFEVENRGDEPMPFSLGAHPAFALDWEGAAGVGDYLLRFDEVERCPHLLYGAGGVSRARHALLVGTDTVSLDEHTFDRDALIFDALVSRAVTLEAKGSPRKVRVEFPGFTHLGLWAKPAARFVCIEPWFGLDDFEDAGGALVDKEGIVLLAPGETFRCEHRIVLT